MSDSPKYTKEQILTAVSLANNLEKNLPTGISTAYFPWGASSLNPRQMHFKILNQSSAILRQDEISTCQRAISKENLCSMVSNPEYVVRSDKPKIVRVDGVDLIYDGHHRLATYWIYGEMEVECLLLEAEKTTPPTRRSISY